MRPERLEVAGFGVFREPTVVDFTGADLFALSGPTGAGKSTIIDAIAFALYGSVPRYDNKNLVAPVISQGKLEARVRLDFAVGDEAFRVVRIVRVAGKGATTKEARLERVESSSSAGDRDGAVIEVLAGSADEVSAVVEAMLGLSYEHFTTCVVLPQGEFQRFLHQKPSARQDLLVELLGLELYGHMAQRARERATGAHAQLEWTEKQLEDLGRFTPELRAQFEGEIAELEKLVVLIDATEPIIAERRAAAMAAEAISSAAAARRALLDGIVMPPTVAALAGSLDEATGAMTAAVDAEHEAAAALDHAQHALAALPDRSTLAAARRDHEQHAVARARIDKGQQVVTEALAAEHRLLGELDEVRQVFDSATVALDTARAVHRAHEFAASLKVGDPCPVCLHQVEHLPRHALDDLDALAASVHEATRALDLAEQAARDATNRREGYQARLRDVEEDASTIADRLADHPDVAVIDVALAAIGLAEEAVVQAREVERQRRAGRLAAEQRMRDLRDAERTAWRRFDEARDAVAALGPPPTGRVGLLGDWQALVAWADHERPRAEAEVEQAREAARAAADDVRLRTAELADSCRAVGIEIGSRPVRDVVVDQLSNARADLDRVKDGLTRISEREIERDRLAQQERVAVALGTHLRSTGFEKWFLDEVLERLVGGATEILHQLSGGNYSLTFDGRSNFMVVDHANADAVRSARTLSGGETFLASLALALALADEVAQLASRGTVRLESIFLDEGFGTLDPDTLDVVATAIEELGARGRVVGLVTHVHDLAERLPTRFEVSRQGNASTVRRLDT